MRRWFRVLKPALIGMLMLLTGAGFAVSADEDDSLLFVEAFTAYQKKDYLLAIEKIGYLNQQFPDTPLRDVALLLLARAGYKSGDNELAAKSINQFNADFSANPLRTTIEEDIASLGVRLQKGEKLAPNKAFQTAARKVRNDVLAQERAIAEKREQERLAKARAEQERIAREKAEAERKERERLAAEKAAKESIKVAISFPEGSRTIEAGENGRLPFEIVSRSKGREEFLLETSAAPEFAAQLNSAAQPDQQVSRIVLAPGETFKGIVSFRMPADRVDGHRSSVAVRATSATYRDVVHSRENLVVASAPLVRVVGKPLSPRPAAGEQFRYRISVLNLGTLAAQGLTARIVLPPQLDPAGSPTAGYRPEPQGAAFTIATLETGTLQELILDVKVRQDARSGQELRPQIEVINGKLQRKEIFPAAAVMIKGPNP